MIEKPNQEIPEDNREHEINRYWKRIMNTMDEGLMLVGPEGSIIMVNEAFETMTGYSNKEVMGKACTMLNCDACEMALESNDEAWCSLFHEEVKKKCRCNIVTKDGTFTPVLKNASILKDDHGNVIGAVETLTDVSEIVRLDSKINQLSRQAESEGNLYGLIGESASMQNVFKIIKRAADSVSPVIIFGESGTGKELVARAIHLCGSRKNGPYVQVNCAALSESLVESELFGHTKGAFTGAYHHRIGRFEAAQGGDLFLDEIGDIPLPIQTKLLRVLESRFIERVGDNKPIFVDARIISATNQNLYSLIAENKFRKDFFFRINVIPIHIPPLRERKEDIPLIVTSLIRQLASETGKAVTGISSDALEYLISYSWPGNVRELRSAIEYSFVIVDKGHIGADHLPPTVLEREINFSGGIAMAEARTVSEKEALIKALRENEGNQSKTAKALGVSRVTIWNRINKYQIDLNRLSI
jgi:two-component system, NtrC family, response regulator HydG